MTSESWTMKLTPLIEDLERLQLKLQVEAALKSDDRLLSKRLTDMALEAADAVDRVKSLVCETAVTDVAG